MVGTSETALVFRHQASADYTAETSKDLRGMQLGFSAVALAPAAEQNTLEGGL